MKTKKPSRTALKNKVLLEGGFLAKALAHAEKAKSKHRLSATESAAKRCVALVLKECVAFASQIENHDGQKRAFLYCLQLAADELKGLAVSGITSGDIP